MTDQLQPLPGCAPAATETFTITEAARRQWQIATGQLLETEGR